MIIVIGMKQNEFIQDILEPIFLSREVSGDDVREALERCMNDVLASSINKSFKVLIQDNAIRVYVENGHPPIPFDPNRIKKNLVLSVKQLIPQYIKQYEDNSRYNYWRTHLYKIREGSIIRMAKEEARADVLLQGNHVGFMPKIFFARHEKYENGQSMVFYVAKVLRPCKVVLSRNSIKLPIAYLEDKLPELSNRFVCSRRKTGRVTVIESEVRIPDSVVCDLSRELREKVIVLTSKRPSCSAE